MPTNLFNTGNSSTPSTTQGQLKSPSFFGNLGFGQATQPAAQQLPPLVKPTASGGVSVPPAAVAAYKKPAPATPAAQALQGLAQYSTTNYPSPNGGTIATADGQPAGFTPNSGFSINTSTAAPSDALSSYANPQQTHAQYSDYVNALSQAQGYSSDYINAQRAAYTGQANQAALGTSLIGKLTPNLQDYLKDPLKYSGDTMDFAQGINGQEQALATQQQTKASIDLNAAQLQRTGNIAAAQTQLQYSPTGMSGANAINQYNALQQQYPNAGIPPFNPALDPLAQQQLAQQLVASSPAYQAGFTSTYQNAQGGTDVLNKLSLGALQKNANGTYSLVNGADKALGDANANIVNTQAGIYSNIDAALTSFNKTAASTLKFMGDNHLNQSNVPIVNQLENAIKAKTAPAGALAAFKIDVTNLQNDYAAFLTARNGSVAGTNQEAANAINIDTLSPAQMQIIFAQMQNDGKNTQAGALSQIQKATQGLHTNTAASAIPSQTSGSSIYDF